jgi:hypothetical protein
MKPARWYCPPGVAKPAHAVVPGQLPLLPHAGPSGAPPGGIVYGGVFEDCEPGWQSHPAGHWFHLAEAIPAQLIRLDTHPRLVTWREVAGAIPGHLWRVPALLEPVRDDRTGNIELFISSLDRTWNGTGWDTPLALADLQRRLLRCHYSLGQGAMSLYGAEAVRMALDVLALGQVFDPAEAVAAGWVSEVLVVRTLCAAVSLEIG